MQQQPLPETEEEDDLAALMGANRRVHPQVWRVDLLHGGQPDEPLMVVPEDSMDGVKWVVKLHAQAELVRQLRRLVLEDEEGMIMPLRHIVQKWIDVRTCRELSHRLQC